jgi:CRP/FNR family transcriptional regulator, nitrogen fixation regulation protein
LKNSHSYQKNEKVYGQGETATYICQVVSGVIRIFSKHSNGNRQIGSFCFPGDVFGLEPGPRHRWSAEAVVEATTVRLVRRKTIVRKAQSNLSLAIGLWNLTARDLLRADDHRAMLGLAATDRMVAFFLGMNSRIGVNGEIDLPMKGTDIADYVGLSQETVARVISKLADKGVLRGSGSTRWGRRLNLHRPERLRAKLPPLLALDLPPISDRLIQAIFSPI